MNLRTGTLYRARLKDVSFGRVPVPRLVETLSSGRLCSILLEEEIAARFKIQTGTQGASPDLIDPVLGTIQMKTFRSSGEEVYQRGRHKGLRKSSVPTVWTTKSGLWDRVNSLTDHDRQVARDYLTSYDHFMYVDISRMPDLRFEFVAVPNAVVAEASDGFRISEDAIRGAVTSVVDLGD